MDLQFCDVCNNLLYKYKKNVDNNTLTLKCRQGHVKVYHFDSKPPRQKEETKKVIDYDFPNKEASRKIVRKMLEDVQKKGLVKPFKKQKVLILTHVGGYDLKQCLLPLGYRKENIHVIEREKDVYEQICSDDFFDGCIVENMHLEQFKRNKKYDLIYLDFKSNMSYTVLDIIQRLLRCNSRDGTAFYINLQMARETETIMKVYYNLENTLMETCDQQIELTNEAFAEFTQSLDGALQEASKMGSGLEIKINGRKYRFKDKGSGIDPSLVNKSLSEIKERFETKITTEKESVKALEDRCNSHVLRQKALKMYIKTVLNTFLLYTDEFSDCIDKDRFSVDLEIDPFTIDDFPPRRKRIVPVMRYMGKTLNPVHFSHFIYKSQSTIPFLNTFFVLKSQDGILDSIGFNNFSSVIAECCMVFYLKAKDMVRQSSILRSIVNYSLLEEFLIGNVESEDDIAFFDQDHQNEVREKLNMMRQAYTDLKDLNLLTIDDDGYVVFRFLDSSLKPVDYSGDYSEMVMMGKSGKLRDRKASVSSPVLMFYVIFKFFNALEKEIGKNVEVTECPIVDVNDGDVDGEVERAFPVIHQEDPLLRHANIFKKYVMGTISRLEKLKNVFDGQRSTIRNLGSRLEELIFESDVLASFKGLFKQQTENGGGIMEAKKPDHLTDDQIKQLMREFVAGNYNTNATIIAEMVNDHVREKHGYDPKVTMPMIAAHKYWHRVNVIEKATS